MQMSYSVAKLKERVDALKVDTKPEKESFEALFNQQFGAEETFEGSVVKGRVVSIDKESVTVDVGLKSEGRIPIREFALPGQELKTKIGDEIEVFVERVEDKNGEAVLSREKARREEAWIDLEKSHKSGERVTGIIFGKVKGGFTVDLSGAVAFLPGSQVDIRPVRDITPLMNAPQPFVILKMDRARGNIVVSRRAILEESREEARSEIISAIKEGQVLQGVVKNITDYGAFIDLGGVDGLLHVTDISWSRINHPSEVLKIGQSIDVQVIKFNQDNQRISLGMKQLESDPWDKVAGKYKVGTRLKGVVSNIADYGAFIELEPGIEGLVHVSEMSWTKKNVHPGKIVATSQEVEVMVLEVDEEKRRISLGIKQCQDNPWSNFGTKYPEGTIVEGTISNITEFGLFVGLDGGIDGMVHVSDLSWDGKGEELIKGYNKGDKIEVKILEIDPEKERIALGVKQLSGENPSTVALDGLNKGDVVTCTITEVTSGGIAVSVKETAQGFIKKADLARDKSEQRTERFAVGEKVDAKILTISKKDGKLTLSIKIREIDEDKQAMAEYGSSDSGASLGDILGAAMAAKESSGKEEKKPAAKKAPKKKTEE